MSPNKAFNYSKTTFKGFMLLTIALTMHKNILSITIKGQITNEKKIPYAGANVVLNYGEYGTISDKNGCFIFYNVPSKHYELSVSAIGYMTARYNIDSTNSAPTLSISLTPNIKVLDEVKISGERSGKRQTTSSISIELISEEFLKEAKAGNLMQTLKKIPGIHSMDIGSGNAKPMIRGLGYYRVVVAKNGIRQEGQQWSSHHGIVIDQESIKHVEVIKGPASLQYGSGAIGGVINILPEHIPLSSGITGDLSLIARSNTNWLGGSGNISFRKRDLYLLATLTHHTYGDFKIPDTKFYWLPSVNNDTTASHKVPLGNRIMNTAGRENAVSLRTGILKKWGNSYLEFSYHSLNSGFFDWQGMLNDSIHTYHAKSYRDFQFPYQQIRNISVNHFTNRYFNKNKLEIALGYQWNISKEHNHLTDRTGERSLDFFRYQKLNGLDLLLDLRTITGNIAYSINGIRNHKFKFGVSSRHQQHQKDGFNHILPEYQYIMTGGFFTYSYSVSGKWHLHSGIRYDFNLFEMKKTVNPEPMYGDSILNPDFRKTFSVTSFSIGINYIPAKNSTLKINLGKTFRLPSAYELGAYGLHRHEGRFEKGDTTNRPEQAWQFDLGFEQSWNNLSFSISTFLNYFTNYLFLNPTPTIRPEGQVYEYQQTRSMLTGGETSLDYIFMNKFNLNIGAEYVYAVNLELNNALPFTPPFNAQTEISYLLKNTKKLSKSKIGVELISVAKQKYTTINELTTPGYNSVNLNAGTSISIGKQNISFMIKVRNLLDNRYYNHISFYRRLRIPGPGRDIQFFINIPFN